MSENAMGATEGNSGPEDAMGATGGDFAPEDAMGAMRNDPVPENAMGATGGDSAPENAMGATKWNSTPEDAMGATGDDSELEDARRATAGNSARNPREGAAHGALRVLDAYCGAGTITLVAAARGARCLGVEIVAPAIENARRNAARNGLADRARFVCGDAAREIPRQIARGERFDAAILDPPRKGADAALLDALADASIPRIAYVSCDPATLARDVKHLTNRGYALQWAQPVDMFPWTGHVETVCQLVLKGHAH